MASELLHATLPSNVSIHWVDTHVLLINTKKGWVVVSSNVLSVVEADKVKIEAVEQLQSLGKITGIVEPLQLMIKRVNEITWKRI